MTDHSFHDVLGWHTYVEADQTIRLQLEFASSDRHRADIEAGIATPNSLSAIMTPDQAVALAEGLLATARRLLM